ncbi:MAG: alpha/beta hydrolase [Burkholderiaceae bacterium]|nr:alpha/beta hydrolase [Burkholderiaceae bacterium]
MAASLLLRLLGLLLILTSVGIALSRAPDRPVQTLVARWAPPPSDFIEVKGQLVHLRDEGPRSDPAPLLLLHGTGASLHTWDGWAAALKAHKRVIRIDLPGFGLTGPFSGQYASDDYRGDTYARFVLDVMAALGLSRAAIGGNSLGGEIAWRAATLAPQRFAQLILVDATGYAFTPDDIPLGLRIARIPVLARIGEYLLPRAVVAASLRSVYGDPARIGDELIDRTFELTLREGNRRALGLRLQQLEADVHAERIKTLALPTLVLWGGRDRLVPLANGERFAAEIRGAKLVVFDALGHVPQEEDPARTVAVVTDFLENRP